MSAIVAVVDIVAEAWANLVDYLGRYRRRPEHQLSSDHIQNLAAATIEGVRRAMVYEIERERRLEQYWGATVKRQMRSRAITGGRL